MPDENGKLTPEEHRLCNAKFEEYEKKVGHDLTCEVCGGIIWALLPHVSGLPVDSPLGPIGARRRTAVLTYMCFECGNMKFFPTAKWGIDPVPPQKPASGAGEADDGSN